WFSLWRYWGWMLMPLVWMSRSAMPAARIAATTLAICAELALSAALASAAWVTTPVDRLATSGTRLASARAVTESRVPSVAATGAADWAWALVIARAPVARLAASSREAAGRNMVVSGECCVKGRQVPVNGP